jgi:hypothetical protein
LSVDENGPESTYPTPPVTPEEDVILVVQVQVLSFLQEARDSDIKAIAIKVIFFI